MLRSPVSKVIRAELLKAKIPLRQRGGARKVDTKLSRRSHRAQKSSSRVTTTDAGTSLTSPTKNQRRKAAETRTSIGQIAKNPSGVDPLTSESSSRVSRSGSEEMKKYSPSVEAALWSIHPLSRFFNSGSGNFQAEDRSLNSWMPTLAENPGKDIRDYQFRIPTHSQLSLDSREQEILKQI